MNTKLTFLITVAFATVALSGCTGSDDGVIVQEGSSTLKPLATAWAVEVAQLGLDPIVQGGGSGHGASGICNGELHIGDMSRAMKGYADWDAAGRPDSGAFGSEIDECLANGVHPVEWKVALDALSVVVSKDNDFVQDLTVEQLAEVFGNPDVDTWDQVDASFPAEPIGLCFPGDGHGTHGYFLEEVVEEAGYEAFRAENTLAGGATYFSTNGGYDEIVNCVKESKDNVGFFGYSYYDANRDVLNGVLVEGVAPTIDNVVDGTYTPLGRYLFMYTAAEMPDKLVQYFEFAYGEGQSEDLMTSAGFIPLDAPTLKEMKDQLAGGQ